MTCKLHSRCKAISTTMVSHRMPERALFIMPNVFNCLFTVSKEYSIDPSNTMLWSMPVFCWLGIWNEFT
jgi:hypothetical protein